jgi:GTP-binding protein HflX
VGYTNAGKSTLLNALTKSQVAAEDKLFATLDPVSRRIRFPQEREVVFTDTVGFIRHLPAELKEAFQATLEELDAADVLIHVADASHPEVEEQIRAVQAILEDMSLTDRPVLLALNKWDQLDDEGRVRMRNAYPHALPISAVRKEGLALLVDRVLARLGGESAAPGRRRGLDSGPLTV